MKPTSSSLTSLSKADTLRERVGGGGGVMKRKISREVIYRQLKSQGKRLKAMSISLGSVSVVEKSTALSFLFNFVSDHPSPTPTLCPK